MNTLTILRPLSTLSALSISLLLSACGTQSAINYPLYNPINSATAARQAALAQQIQDQVQPRDRVTLMPANGNTHNTAGTTSPAHSSTSPAQGSTNNPTGKLPVTPTEPDVNVLLPEGPQTGEALSIKLYRSYGDQNRLRIWGRVIDRKDDTSASENDSKWQNFWRNVSNLTVDEVEGVKVRFLLQGKTFEVTSNDEGMLEVEITPPAPLEPGQYTLYAALVPGQEYQAPRVAVPLTIHAQSDHSLGVVSDIDDTLVRSDVSEKIKAVSRLLLNNAYNSEPIPGTSPLMRALEMQDGKKDGDVFYLSGSPLNYSDRIHAYLDYQNYPKGPVNLKKWGFSENDDNPIQQSDYKLRKLRELFNFYPEKPFVLFGDSSEVDTEIYTQIAQEFPGRVKAIFINNVNGQDPNDARFAQVNLTTHARQAAQKLVAMKLLPESVLASIN